MLFRRGIFGTGLLLVLVCTASSVTAIEQQRGGPIYEPKVDKIVIGVKDFRLIAISNKRLVFDYGITVGADTAPTPLGRFTVISRLKHPWYTPNDEPAKKPGASKNPLGTRWLGISKPSYGLHGTNEPGTVGTKDSEGCVRLPNLKIEKLYNHVSRGIPVVIKKRIPRKYSKLRSLKHTSKTGEKHHEKE